jgi:chemotaxis protein CheD
LIMASSSPGAPPSVGKTLVVGVGGLAVANKPFIVLTTYSLGSCLGITVYDPVARAGGLLHAMLPDSALNPQKAGAQPAMFVDTGLDALLQATRQFRVEERRLQICVAGGAQILDEGGFFNIGLRNHRALKEALGRRGLPIVAHQVGGFVSRTLSLELGHGRVLLKTGLAGETILFPG